MKHRKPISRDQCVLFEECTHFNPLTETVTEELIAIREFKARHSKKTVGGHRW